MILCFSPIFPSLFLAFLILPYITIMIMISCTNSSSSEFPPLKYADLAQKQSPNLPNFSKSSGLHTYSHSPSIKYAQKQSPHSPRASSCQIISQTNEHLSMRAGPCPIISLIPYVMTACQHNKKHSIQSDHPQNPQMKACPHFHSHRALSNFFWTYSPTLIIQCYGVCLIE